MSPEYRKTIKLYLNFDYEKSDIFSVGLIILRIE